MSSDTEEDSLSSETTSESSSDVDWQEIIGNTSNCRLCLEHVETNNKDLFSSLSSTDDGRELSYATMLQQAFNITYKEHVALPRYICKRCFTVVGVCFEFYRCLLISEKKMQDRLHEFEMMHPKFRPGLNGNPGVFEPDENCEIIEVNLNEKFNTSEEEYSSESEAETVTGNDTIQQVEESNNTSPLVNKITQQTNTETNSFQAKETTQANGQERKYFYCHYCDTAFTTLTELHSHENQHDRMLPFNCVLCDKHLLTRKLLVTHNMQSHKLSRPSVCAVCKKSFARRSDLKNHAIIHTGARPFTCPVCSKSFSRLSNLNQHKRLHSKTAPYTSSKSNELLKPSTSSSFTSKEHLKINENVHVLRAKELMNNNKKTASTGPQLFPDNETTKELPLALSALPMPEPSQSTEHGKQQGEQSLHVNTPTTCGSSSIGFNRSN